MFKAVIFFDFFLKFLSHRFICCIYKNNNFESNLKNYDLFFFLKFIRLNSFLQFDVLNDIAVVDFQHSLNRFKVTYNFTSSTFWKKLSLNYFLSELGLANSIRRLFKISDWIEREIWDMFGVFFINHNDLRRILTDYGFKGYPLKKDFPLTGYFELRFDDSRGDVFYEPVELTQELRFFNFASGWERE